jgi:hypothetical protein
MSTQIFINNVRTTISNVVGPSDSLISVADTTKFPLISESDYLLITLESSGILEVVKIVSPGKIGGDLTVGERGLEGTTPSSFPIGARAEARLTAGSITNIVTSTNSALAVESLTRATTVTGVQTNLTTEIADRTAAVSTLTTALATEVSTRTYSVATKAPIDTPVFTGSITAPNSVAATPSIISPGSNTGVYFPSSSTVGLACNGASVLLASPSNITSTLPILGVSAAAKSNDTKLATTHYVDAAVSSSAPEIISGTSASTGTINRSYVGLVLIEFYGYSYSDSNTSISWDFLVNGSSVNGRNRGANFQVSAHPSWKYLLSSSGAFSVSMSLYGDNSVYFTQISLTYL